MMSSVLMSLAIIRKLKIYMYFILIIITAFGEGVGILGRGC